MRVLDKTFQMNEAFQPVLRITLEMPMEVSNGSYMKGEEFMDKFYEAIKLYEDQKTTKATGR